MRISVAAQKFFFSKKIVRQDAAEGNFDNLNGCKLLDFLNLAFEII
jgi:hypothetical protein